IELEAKRAAAKAEREKKRLEGGEDDKEYEFGRRGLRQEARRMTYYDMDED
ncbi:unnamed protein product, partial [Cyprideis torosa]